MSRAATIAVLILIALPAAAAAAPRDERLRSVSSWAFAIGTGDLRGDLTGRLAPFDLVVVDAEEATPAQVARLRAGGKLVLGYLSVGTIERGRSWYGAARPYRLELWEDWGEWYADVRRPGYRRLIERRVAPALLRKGFDGLFLDNVDMVETHGRQRRGMTQLVRRLSHDSRAQGRLLFAQNGDEFVPSLARFLDGWNREDVTWTYDFDSRRYKRVGAEDTRAARATLHSLAARGLLVTATDYTRAGDDRAASEAAANACAAGALPFVSDIGLTRLPPLPLTCPAAG